MYSFKSIEELNPAGKKVFLRVDFNVPLRDGVVTDDTRIVEALPTINYLLKGGASIIILSHLGRPKGEGYEEVFSMAPAAKHLATLVDAEVILARDVTGTDARAKAASLKPGQILMLENLRFDKREKKNDESFCKELAPMADAYVNDAFGAAHRAHASMYGLAKLLPCYAGYLMTKEVETLSGILDEPKRPFVAVLGGSKVSDKIKIINSLIDKADTLIIGGGMCFTFLLAQGKTVGTSLKEEEWVEPAKEMLARAKEKGVSLLLPVDVVCADRFARGANTLVTSVDEIPDDMMGLDIGPETAKMYAEAIAGAQSVFWNGPMGVFEMKAFEEGTKQVALAIAANKEADTVIGGGDSVAAVNKFDLADQMTFISTGGGASMALVQGEELPAVAVLEEYALQCSLKGSTSNRKPLVVGNWKMNKTLSEAVVLTQHICNRFDKEWGETVDVALCTPFLDLKPAWTVVDFEHLPIAIGAQNVYWEENGAYTGEISVPMLREVGCQYCIVGHSERRALFGELNEHVNKKAKALLAGKMTPIICVGESLAVHEEGSTIEYVTAQVEAALAGIDATDARRCVLAYEPVWAIGTGRTAAPYQAQEVCAAIRSTLGKLYGLETAVEMRILYGGSINVGNFEGLMAMEDIDGGLVGGASLEAESFITLVKACL